MLRGFNNFMMDLIRYPKQLNQLLKRINETYLQGLETSLKYKSDAVFVLDDLGTQTDVFTSPELFKKHFGRFYKEQIKFAHDHDMHFVLHSCGAINKYIPIFIDWGVDVLEFDSPHMVGFQTIEKYKDKTKIKWGDLSATLKHLNNNIFETREISLSGETRAEDDPLKVEVLLDGNSIKKLIVLEAEDGVNKIEFIKKS